MRISDWSSDVCSSDLVHKDDAAAMARLRAAFEAPSLYDELLKLLARRGFDIPADRLERDWTQPYEPSEAVEKAGDRKSVVLGTSVSVSVDLGWRRIMKNKTTVRHIEKN